MRDKGWYHAILRRNRLTLAAGQVGCAGRMHSTDLVPTPRAHRVPISKGATFYDIRPAGRAPRYSDTPFTIGDGRSRPGDERSPEIFCARGP